jgi:hypothetical protein
VSLQLATASESKFLNLRPVFGHQRKLGCCILYQLVDLSRNCAAACALARTTTKFAP